MEDNFEPSLTAKLSVTDPSGKIINLPLPASLDIEGRFARDFISQQVGEYSLNITCVFVDKTEVRKKFSCLASESSSENATLPLNERLLKEISRISAAVREVVS